MRRSLRERPVVILEGKHSGSGSGGPAPRGGMRCRARASCCGNTASGVEPGRSGGRPEVAQRSAQRL